MNARALIASRIAARRAATAPVAGPVEPTLAERLTRESQAKRYVRKHGPVTSWVHTPSGSWSVATYRDGVAKVFPRV